MLFETYYLISVMLINTLSTDLHLDVLDQDVAEPVQPTETSVSTGRGLGGHSHSGQLHAEVHTVNQITVARYGACNFLAEVG